MLAKSQLQASGSGEPTGGYLVWVGAGLLAVDGGSSKLAVDEAPRLPPQRLPSRHLVPAAGVAFAAILAVMALAPVSPLVVEAAR